MKTAKKQPEKDHTEGDWQPSRKDENSYAVRRGHPRARLTDYLSSVSILTEDLLNLIILLLLFALYLSLQNAFDEQKRNCLLT